MNAGRRLFAASLVLLAATGVSAQRPQTPTFRSGVEFTTIDVTVVDRDGKPIVDLKPEDFIVTVDGASRRVARAEWVGLTTTSEVRAVDGPRQQAPTPSYSTNEGLTRGRLIVLAIDQPNIRPDGVMSVRASLETFVDRLAPSDRIAVVALGQGGVSTPFTGDRGVIKRALSSASGYQRSNELSDYYQISVQRALANGEPAELTSAARSEALEFFGAFSGLLNGLKAIALPKTVVLVSEGFPLLLIGLSGSPIGAAEIVELGSLAAAARADVFVLRLDSNRTSASNRGVSRDIVAQDRLMRASAVDLLTSATRGEVFDVLGNGATALSQIERQTSGYYLVGMESAAIDADGRPHALSVRVSRRGAVVRARRNLSPVALARAALAPKEAVVEALASPLLENGLTIRVSTTATRDADSSKVRLQLSGQIGDGYESRQEIAVAYLITDSRGRSVVEKTGTGRLSPASTSGSALAYTVEESVPPGDYVWKLAVAEGPHVGSVEHAIHTGPLEDIPIAVRPPPDTSAASATPPAPRAVVAPVTPRTFRREEATAANTLKKFEAGVAAEGRAAFAQGVAALSAGNHAAAEEGFRAALQSGFAGGKTVAPMTYLGATFAASGRDAEAVGIWQVALTDGSAFAEIYDWLAEALIRMKDLAQARSILKEAAEKWPAEARFASRLAELSPAGATR